MLNKDEQINPFGKSLFFFLVLDEKCRRGSVMLWNRIPKTTKTGWADEEKTREIVKVLRIKQTFGNLFFRRSLPLFCFSLSFHSFNSFSLNRIAIPFIVRRSATGKLFPRLNNRIKWSRLCVCECMWLWLWLLLVCTQIKSQEKGVPTIFSRHYCVLFLVFSHSLLR